MPRTILPRPTVRPAAALATALVALVVLAAAAAAQEAPAAPPRAVAVQEDRSGPRFGVTFLGGAIVDSLATRYDTKVQRMITQFGWHFERQITATPGGLTTVSEWVMLVGGLDQGAVLPSLSWIVGLRTRSDLEFGVGPNLTPAGVALVLAGGQTFHTGGLTVPVNFAVVPSRVGTRVSVITGFNTHR